MDLIHVDLEKEIILLHELVLMKQYLMLKLEDALRKQVL